MTFIYLKNMKITIQKVQTFSSRVINFELNVLYASILLTIIFAIVLAAISCLHINYIGGYIVQRIPEHNAINHIDLRRYLSLCAVLIGFFESGRALSLK